MILLSFSLIISRSLLEIPLDAVLLLLALSNVLSELLLPFLAKQASQKSGLSEVGLNGTSQLAPHEEQVTLVFCILYLI